MDGFYGILLFFSNVRTTCRGVGGMGRCYKWGVVGMAWMGKSGQDEKWQKPQLGQL